MGKILKMNASGTLGVSIPKIMKDGGYVAGKKVEWIAQPNGFLLKIVDVPLPPAPIQDAVGQVG